MIIMIVRMRITTHCYSLWHIFFVILSEHFDITITIINYNVISLRV